MFHFSHRLNPFVPAQYLPELFGELNNKYIKPHTNNVAIVVPLYE